MNYDNKWQARIYVKVSVGVLFLMNKTPTEAYQEAIKLITYNIH